VGVDHRGPIHTNARMADTNTPTRTTLKESEWVYHDVTRMTIVDAEGAVEWFCITVGAATLLEAWHVGLVGVGKLFLGSKQGLRGYVARIVLGNINGPSHTRG